MARDTSAADYSRMKLDEDPAAYIRAHTMGGHTYESHVGVSDETLLDNVLTGKKRGDTAYKDAETEIYCTSELLYANMDRIIAFAEGTSSKDKGSRIVLQSDFYDRRAQRDRHGLHLRGQLQIPDHDEGRGRP